MSAQRRTIMLPSILALGLGFLYLPIASLIVYSFNASRLVTVWDAVHSPTLKWYGELFHNRQILEAAWLSVRIAVMNATGAVILGTLAGLALARFGRFRGRTLLGVHVRTAGDARDHYRPVAAGAVHHPRADDWLAGTTWGRDHHIGSHQLFDLVRRGHRPGAARRFRQLDRGSCTRSGSTPRARSFAALRCR